MTRKYRPNLQNNAPNKVHKYLYYSIPQHVLDLLTLFQCTNRTPQDLTFPFNVSCIIWQNWHGRGINISPLTEDNQHTLHLRPNPYRAITLSVSVIKTNQLMLYREIISVCSQIHTKHVNTLCEQKAESVNVKLAVHIVTTGLKRVKSLL